MPPASVALPHVTRKPTSHRATKANPRTWETSEPSRADGGFDRRLPALESVHVLSRYNLVDRNFSANTPRCPRQTVSKEHIGNVEYCSHVPIPSAQGKKGGRRDSRDTPPLPHGVTRILRK